MIVLDSATTVLQTVLAGSVSANQPESVVAFKDENQQGEDTKYAAKRIALNSNTDVTICAAPQQNFVRNIETISIYNKDTASVTVTVKTDDGSTEFIIVKQILLAGETLAYEHLGGWQIV